MGALDGRVAIITGAGRGLGREHALLFASEGAKVVVNDLGGDMHGEGGDPSSAMQTVDDIKAMGCEAVVNGDNVADWDGAKRLVQQAIDAFGDLHVLVNNAGILRDRVIVNMTEAEWDAVIAVHLKGHFCPTRHAAAYWREQTKAGKEVNAAIVHTSSTSVSASLSSSTAGKHHLCAGDRPVTAAVGHRRNRGEMGARLPQALPAGHAARWTRCALAAFF